MKSLALFITFSMLIPNLALAANKCGEQFGLAKVARANAAPQVEKLNIEFSDRRAVYVEYNVQNTNEPVMVFMPGIYRGLKAGDGIYDIMANSKSNWVALHFSSHPESIFISKSTPASKPNLENLAQEVETVLATMEIHNYSLISLSYSGAVTAQMTSSPGRYIIESAPMGRYNEAMGAIGQSQDAWSGISGWMTGGMDQFFKDIAYRNYWTQHVSKMALSDSRLKDPYAFNALVNGYIGLAKAAEGYDIKNIQWKDEHPRAFFLAEQELEARKQHQVQGILNYIAQTQQMPFLALFKDGEHNLSTSHPKSYFALVQILNSGKVPPNVFGAIVNPEGKIKWLSAKQALKEVLGVE